MYLCIYNPYMVMLRYLFYLEVRLHTDLVLYSSFLEVLLVEVMSCDLTEMFRCPLTMYYVCSMINKENWFYF